MTQERESKLPDDSSTQEIIREKTMQMTKNIRTGYYTVVMDPKYTARPAAPGGRREQVSSSCRAHICLPCARGVRCGNRGSRED